VRSSVDVHNFLVERDIAHEVLSTRGRLRSAERMAAVLGLPPAEVGKVRILEGPEGPVAAVVASDRSLDESKVARAIGRNSLEPARDERASEITEYLTEVVPPVGLPDGIPLVVDRPLNRDVVLYFPAGEVRAVLKIRGKDLVEATKATVAPISAPSPQRTSRRRSR
jgi:prolyl-tRNA editing enzyme YbaK/EbsC (Cys-tRNA(Pro) deacylase)